MPSNGYNQRITEYTSGHALVSGWAEHRGRRKAGQEDAWLADKSNAPTPKPTDRLGDPEEEQRRLDDKRTLVWDFDPDQAHIAYIRVELALVRATQDAKQASCLSKCAYAIHTGQFDAHSLPKTVVWKEVHESLEKVPDLYMERLYKVAETINKLRIGTQEKAS